ncbi:unnamed protein product [Adineta steineri]|nr:unnamed protein product [Adineta steineri]
MKIGDFNNDNRADLVFTYGNLDYISIVFGIGNGTFRIMDVKLETRECIPDDIAVTDFNHDNYSDIVLIDTSFAKVCVFLGNANDTYSSYLMFSTGQYSSPRSVTISDFNSDGHPDIAVANNKAVNIGIFLGRGNGSFEVQKRSFTFMGSYPIRIVSDDFDGDAQQDVVIADDMASTKILTVLSKYRNGVFTVKSMFVLTSDLITSHRITSALFVGDFNCDNHVDIAAKCNSYGIDVLLGYGNGHFETQSILPNKLISFDSKFGVYDFNDDTYQDIIIANPESSSIDILLNIGECCVRGILKRKTFNFS